MLADTPLKSAARAQALCMVVRTSERKLKTGDVVEILDYRDQRQLGPITCKIDLVFKATKGKRSIDGDVWDWTRIDRIPAKVSSRSGKFKLILIKCLFFRRLQSKDTEQEFFKIPTLVVKPRVLVKTGNPVFRPSSSSMATMDHRRDYGICQLSQGDALSIVSPVAGSPG